MESGGDIKIMNRIFFKKFIVLSLVFVLFLTHNVFAEDINTDTLAPSIELIGAQRVSVDVGQNYLEQGVIAMDDIDGDISSFVSVSNTVDVTKPGVYVVTYNVSDKAGNSAPQVEREVVVKEIVLTKVLDIFVRDGENVIYDSVVNLPTSGVVNILDKEGESHEVNSQSALALIYSISQEADAPFLISNLQYYSSMDAFYLKCITPKGGVELCDNWQYVIGGITPWTGIDQTFVSEGDKLGLYFGTPHKLILDKNEILEGESVVVNSLKYNYVDNTWSVLSGVNIGVSIPNQIDPWKPTVISETAVNENGVAEIEIKNEGIYTFGIKEDYSFPSYQVVVKKRDNSGSSSGGSDSDTVNFSVENALNFLSINQNENGSFWNSLYTDWVAIGISQTGEESRVLKNKIYEFLKNEKFYSLLVTDNERHAMALMALGINPYTGTDTDYIKKIISSFDGEQIGDESLYNDDIFGLIVLSHAGYTKNDEIIKSIVSYIISKQDSVGSWGGIDMTSAGIQSLSNFKSLGGVKESIENAERYLKNNQNTDGGFGDSFSTSWTTQALLQNNSFGLEINNAIDYLKDKQQLDGGLDGSDIKSRVWATSYAIPAVLKLSWNDILESFDKEESDIFSQHDIAEEILPNLDLQPIVLPVEKKEIEIVEKPIKIVEFKKKIIKNRDELKLSIDENPVNNLLSASAIGVIENKDVPLSFVGKILRIINMPFVWIWKFWIHLGF